MDISAIPCFIPFWIRSGKELKRDWKRRWNDKLLLVRDCCVSKTGGLPLALLPTRHAAADSLFWKRADPAIYLLTAFDDDHRGNAHGTITACQARVRVHIHLDHF